VTNRTLRSVVALAFVVLAATSAAPRVRADTVLAGYDLFQTDAANTNFNGVPFMGVPIGLFNFGGSIGVQNVGNTDTIVQRLSSVTAPPGGSGTSSLIMQAPQLETTAPPTAFGPLANYFIPLQSPRGGPATTGTITINFANPTPGPPPPTQPVAGTFTSFFDVFFDIRMGSLTGPIVFSGELPLTNSGAQWSHYPPPGATQIVGVNAFLNGQDHSNDFFPIGGFIEKHPTQGQHAAYDAGAVNPFSVPEPSTVATGSLSFLFGVVLVWRTKRKAA